MKIAMLLSGGVDSSVALRLLRDEGHEVTAFYLKIWLEDELAHLGECPWEDDLRYAREVCETAGVPLEVVPLQREYHQRVVSWSIAELEAGRTPSPDILCNRRVKFGVFYDHLSGATFDRIASGHYARTTRVGETHHLLRGVDPVKDQTYFLFLLDQAQLAHCLFPLGGLLKSEVRQLADELDLPNRNRADSQGICFLGKIPYDQFVHGYLGERPGAIVDVATGQQLGEHRGYWFHTLGQRRGLGLGGGPWYVVGKDTAADVVFVAHGETLGEHSRQRFLVPDVHWIAEPPSTQQLEVRVRHSPRTSGCEVTVHDDGGLEVELSEPDSGIADGQGAAFYDGEVCLGGGMIRTVDAQMPVAH